MTSELSERIMGRLLRLLASQVEVLRGALHRAAGAGAAASLAGLAHAALSAHSPGGSAASGSAAGSGTPFQHRSAVRCASSQGSPA